MDFGYDGGLMLPPMFKPWCQGGGKLQRVPSCCCISRMYGMQ